MKSFYKIYLAIFGKYILHRLVAKNTEVVKKWREKFHINFFYFSCLKRYAVCFIQEYSMTINRFHNWIAKRPVIAVDTSITDTVTGIAGVLLWEVEESFSWSGMAGLAGRM